MSSIIFIKVVLKSFTCASGVLEYSRPSLVGLLGSSEVGDFDYF